MTKRFYKTVEIGKADAGHNILLDGKPVKTPGKNTLSLPGKKLADAVKKEWAEQGDEIRPLTMPMTSIATIAIDMVGQHRAVIMEDLLGYAETDLLCYRAEKEPGLAALQKKEWDPVLSWCADYLKASFKTTQGVMPVAQSQKAVDAFGAYLGKMNDMELAAFTLMAKSTASLLLALALNERHINAKQAFALSRLDENYQSEQWGEDAEATHKAQHICQEIEQAFRFASLL